MTKSSTFSPGVPVYGLTYDAEKGLLAAVGGGGSTKSGVKNRIFLYKLEGTHLTELSSLETGNEAPMNVIFAKEQLYCGVNDRCWIVDVDENKALSLVETFETDKAEDDPYQKLVKLSSGGKLVATTGMDRTIRIWDGSELKHEFHCKEEVSDLVLDDKRMIYLTPAEVTLCDLNSEEQETVQSAETGWEFRCLARVEHHLVVIENTKDRRRSRMSIWSLESLTRLKTSSLQVSKAVTCLFVTGGFAVFGTADGTVGVVRIAGLKTIHTSAMLHSFALTSVQVHAREQSLTIISGSADGLIKVMEIGTSPSSASTLFVIVALLVACLAFILYNQPELLERLQEYLSML